MEKINRQVEQQEPTKPKNIHEAVLAVYGEVGYVPKRGTVEMAANRKYKFAGEAEFIAAIRPAMIEAGIYQHPQGISVITNERIESEKEWNGKTTKTFQHRVVIQSVYRFMHTASETFIDVPAIGEGMDSGDKAFNKAMTIANKYAVRQLFMIETGDDPDKYASKETGGVEDSDKRPETAAARKKRYSDIKEALERSGDPAVVWHENQAEINGFKAQDQTFYDDLLATAKRRKEELAQDKAMSEGMPQDFMEVK